MRRGWVSAQRNLMELVTIKGAAKRKKPHSLTEDESRKFMAPLGEPIRTVALPCVSLNPYGDVVTDEMREAHSKIARMALARA
jgi:hypothetical protein